MNIFMDISNQYRQMGVHRFYEEHHKDYANPHKAYVEDCLTHLWDNRWKTVLDLACGDGLVTKWLKNVQKDCIIEGCDKYFSHRYQEETSQPCYGYSFEDIAKGLTEFKYHYDCIIMSYAIDLVPHSYLNSFLWMISMLGDHFLVIRPNNHVINHSSYDMLKKVKFEKSKGFVYGICR
jgi:trans-aconitate methyltransferase